MKPFLNRRGPWRGARLPACVLGVAFVAAACVSPSASGGGSPDGSGSTASIYGTGMVGMDSSGDPVRGGTLTFAAYSEPEVLDPAQTIVAGTTGGVGMAAVYDVLMRWDPEAKQLRPQLAKKLESSDDYTKWTLTLRSGVTFSDGTALNAEAVAWSIDRYVAEGGKLGKVWQDNVASVETPNPRTVVFTLNSTWPGFEFLLANGPGMIVAPSSVKDDEFTPIGAGPFIVDHHAPQEEIVLTARDDYWDGRPNLNKIEVVFLGSEETALESLQSGSVDAAVVKTPDIVAEAMKNGYGGFKSSASLGAVAVINAEKGRPGHDPRVRKALFQAIDPKVIDQRAYQGAGDPSNAVFPEFSRWHTDVQPLPYDPQAARKLLDAAKADGYDGKITYLDSQGPASRAAALALKAMWEKVGFDVKLNLVRSIPDQIRKVAVDQDYDVAGWGISWREAGPYPKMYSTLHAAGELSVGMYTSQAMSELIEQFKAAETEQAKRKNAGKLQRQWNKDVPALVFGASPDFIAMSDAVHGVEGSSRGIVLLDDAWLTRS